MRNLYMFAYKKASGAVPAQTANRRRYPFGSRLMTWISEMNPDSAIEYKKGQKPFYSDNTPLTDWRSIPGYREFTGEAIIADPKETTHVGDYSWGNAVKPYTSHLGEKFVPRMKKQYEQAIKNRQLPPHSDWNPDPWKYYDKEVPVYIHPGTSYQAAKGDPKNPFNVTPTKVFLSPDDPIARLPVEERIDKYHSYLSEADRMRYYSQAPKANLYSGYPFRLHEPNPEYSNPHSALMHELGHVASPVSNRHKWNAHDNLFYQFKDDAEFKTATRNAVVAARRDLNDPNIRLDTPAEVARFLDELVEKPHLLDRFKEAPDTGKLFRSYVELQKEDPEAAKEAKKAIAIWGANITKAQPAQQRSGFSRQIDPVDMYQNRAPFNFNPYYSNTV